MKFAWRISLRAMFLLVLTPCTFSQVTGVVAATDSAFLPLEQWKKAVIAGDAAALKAFYSVDPAAEIEANGPRRAPMPI